MPDSWQSKDILPLARARLMRVTSRLLLGVWLPVMSLSLISVWDRPVVRGVVLLTMGTVLIAALILWRPSARFSWLQATLFLGLLAVGIPAAGGVSGITPGGMATASVLVAWAALFFGGRGLWGMVGVFAVLLGYTAWQYTSGRLEAPPAPDLRNAGYWWRNILFLLSTFTLGGLVVRAALSAFDEAHAAERAASTAAAKEEAARLVAEAESVVLQRREITSALAAGLAHDIANVLHVSALHAEELVSALRDPADRESAQQILAASERGRGIVRELLALGRRAPTSTEEFDGTELVPRLEAMLRGLLPPTVRSMFRADDGLRLRGDALRFEQVVINLALNARDAMPSGGAFEVSLRRSTEGFARLDVRDSGTGIMPDVQDRIFRPFFTTKEAGEGSGLGLSMVARIVADAGGRIDVDSTVGVGSTFTIDWPLATADAPSSGADRS